MKTLRFLLGLAMVVGTVLFAVDYFRHRFVRKNADLVKLLPPGDLTTLLVDLSLMRQAGMIHLLTGVKPAADREYEEFVRETHFNYMRDMEAMAGATDGEQIFLLVRGHFDWRKLESYAIGHGGTCHETTCRVMTSKAGRFVNFFPVQADVIALAISNKKKAADLLRPPGRREEEAGEEPLWVKFSPSALKNPAGLPLAARVFAITLQSAESVIVSLGRASGGNEAFNIRLNAEFPSEPIAHATKKQLDLQTRMLKLELEKEQQQPNPADLSGLFTGGSFQVVDKRVVGHWPVRRELLAALE